MADNATTDPTTALDDARTLLRRRNVTAEWLADTREQFDRMSSDLATRDDLTTDERFDGTEIARAANALDTLARFMGS